MLPSVYIETTIVSYLVARPSRDATMAERQRQTREWWENRRGEYRLVTSETTLVEARRGETFMARTRLAVLAGVPVLSVDHRVSALADALRLRGALPAKAKADAYHIAAAAIEGINYLLTWDSRHIANPNILRRCEQVCQEHGVKLPILCTPTTLLRR